MSVLLPDGIYSWWLHPIAVNDGDRTWVGVIKGTGLNEVHRIDWPSGEVSSVLLDGPGESNDHNGAAIALNPQRGDVIAFYAQHNVDEHIRYQRIDRDTMQAGPQEHLEFDGTVTYAQVLSDGDTLHVLCRQRPGRDWVYRTSHNWGQSWGPVRTLIEADDDNIYTVARRDPAHPSRYHVAVGQHPLHDPLDAIHYALVDLASGEARDDEGTVLGSLADGPAIDPRDLPAAVTLTGGQRARLLDVGQLGGHPTVAYAVWDGELGPPSYRLAMRRDGSWGDSGWSLPSGEQFGYLPTVRYLGGVTLGHDGRVWTSRHDGQWHVERWRWDGDALAHLGTVEQSATRLIRPYPAEGPGRGELVYQRVGHYESQDFRDWSSDLVAVERETHPDDEPPDAPPPPPAPVAQARIRASVTWLGCDAVTGQVITELPDVRGTVTRLLGAHASTQLTVPVPLSGPGAIGPAAIQATQPRRSMLVAVVNDVPAWAGLVLTRVGGTGAELRLGCVTPEGYLARRKVRDHDLQGVDEARIMAALARDAEDIDGIGQGLGLVHDAPDTGVTRDREYLATDRAWVYDRLRELADVQGGPEWTIDLDWADATQTRVVKILRVRPRIGVAADSPDAVFEAAGASVLSARGGSEATYELTEDWASGKGANWVEAYSSGEGDDQPASVPAIDHDDLDAGAPIYERHYQPSTSITSQSVLDDHAAAELDRLRGGAEVWAITARWDHYPRHAVDWRLGDDVAWELVGHRHPHGVTGRGRVVGWELDLQAGTVRPLLLGEQHTVTPPPVAG